MTLKISTDNIQTATLASLASVSIPKITSITYPGDDTAATTAGGQTITLTGSGFIAGASVIVNGSYAGVVTVVSNTSITFTTPANSGGTYPLYVVNTDGGTAISIPGISYSGTPSWSNTAGSLATVYETAALSTQLTATGNQGDGAITYSVYSGTLPPGSSLNTSTGLLSGTTQATASSTTYTFTIRASDEQNQDTDRAFSITINPDAVTWSSPADGTVTSLFQNQAMANVTLSATSAAGQSIAYTANALPTGVTISGSNVTGTPTVLGNTISVITATAANTNRTATRTFTWVVSVSSDPYFKNTTLLLNGEGASANNGSNNNIFIDSSNNNYAITRAGNASQGTFSPYGYNWSNYFDGTGDYLSIPDNVAFTLGSNDFTFECWVYPTSITNGNNNILAQWGNGNAWIFRYVAAGRPQFSGAATNITGTTTAVTINQWNHVAITRTSGTVRLFVNGVLDATSGTIGALTDGASQVTIGAYSDGTSEYVTGYISNLRLINGTSLYTTTFTPSTTPLTAIANTSLLTCQSNRFIDNSTNNFTITKNGDVSVQAFGPFGSVPEAVPISYSTYLNGSSYVTVPSTSADSLFGSGNYTVEFWTKTDDTSWEMIAPETGVGLALIIASGNLVLQNQYGQAGILTVSASSILNGAWHHVAVVRNSGTITIYFDGTSVGTVSNSTDYSNQNLTYDIGYGNQSAGRYLSGKLSNFRIVNGTAVYTSNFTPPSTPLTNITNTKVLTFQNPTLIDNSSSARSLGVSGTQKIFIDNPFGYTAQSATSYTPSIHGGSIYLDGTGDYLRYNNTSIMTFSGSSNFTVECWVYQTAYTSTSGYMNTIIGDLTPTDATALYWSVGMNASNQPGVRWFDGTVKTADSGTALPLNTWNHVAWVVTSGVVTIFVNGVKSTLTGTTTLTTPSSTVGYYITGADRGTYFTGSMSDLRITRSAIYTSNFVPPAQALSNYSTTYPASLLLNFTNGGIIDQHGTNVLETVGNVQISTAVKKYNNASMYFDGSSVLKVTGTHLLTPTNFRFPMAGEIYTIEGWFYFVTLNSPRSHLIGCFGPGESGWTIDVDQTGNFFFASGGGGTTLTMQSPITTGTWIHLAFVNTGSIIDVYKNGVKNVSSQANYTPGISTNPLHIGRRGFSTGDLPSTVYIDDLRITKGYARYTANFTAPTAALNTK